MESISIDRLSEYLFNRSIRQNVKVSLSEAEEMCKPMIELIGITEAEQNLITQYALTVGIHGIDGQAMMVALGILSSRQLSATVKRTLEHCSLIPKGLEFQATPLGVASIEEQILFTNYNCMIVRKTEIIKGKPRHQMKYMISRTALFKLLNRLPDAYKFADYFSLKQEISEQYVKYESDYVRHLKSQKTTTDIAHSLSDDKVDTDNLTTADRREVFKKQSERFDEVLESTKRIMMDTNRKADAMIQFASMFMKTPKK